MPQASLWGRAIVLATVVLCIAFALAASGGPDKPSASFATVDIKRLESEYKTKATLEGDLAALQTKLDRALTRRQELPLLPEDDHKTLDQLTEKVATAPNDADKKKIDELTKKGLDRNNEIKALQQKQEKDLSDADKANIKGAEEILVKMNATLGSMKDARDNTLRQFINANSERLMKDVREAVKKIAEQKGIAIVFNSEVALYAGQDITTSVLSDLNKK